MRLIDADALIKRHCEDCNADVQESCKTDAVCSLLIWLAEEPTVDAVPVVRCKDCEDYSSGICWHPYITGSCDCDVEKEPDGFCDWGNRKDGGAND